MADTTTRDDRRAARDAARAGEHARTEARAEDQQTDSQDDCVKCGHALRATARYADCHHFRHAAAHLPCCICANLDASSGGGGDNGPQLLHHLYPPHVAGGPQRRMLHIYKTLHFDHPGPSQRMAAPTAQPPAAGH